MEIAIIIIAAAIVLLWTAFTYNNLVGKRNKMKEGFALMDVYLTKRHQLVPNIVATVKAYANHEAKVLEDIVKTRNGAKSMDECVEAEISVSAAIQRVMVAVEAYPDLKATTSFLDLQQQLVAIEEDIQNARRYFNGSVREFNTAIQQFPNSIITGLFAFKPARMFEVNDYVERQSVTVSL